MSELSDISDDAVDAILDLKGETGNYVPAGVADDAREITMSIDRRGVQGIDEFGHGTTVKYMVIVRNSATTGISLDEIDCGADLLEFPPRIGEDNGSFRISRIANSNSSFIELEI